MDIIDINFVRNTHVLIIFRMIGKFIHDCILDIGHIGHDLE